MAALAISGDPRALGLAGLDGSSGGAIVHLGVGEGVNNADVVWHEGSVDAGRGARVIAQDGSGLWRRAPWPARDDLYELGAPADRSVLIVGADSERAEIREPLSDTIEVREADVLKREHLENAAVVLFSRPAGRPLPAPAFAVLATRRILVVREPSVSFGLLAGIDHLSARTAAGAAELAAAAALHWDAFAAVRAFGRIAAEPHRASTVYARIAHDLALEES